MINTVCMNVILTSYQNLYIGGVGKNEKFKADGQVLLLDFKKLVKSQIYISFEYIYKNSVAFTQLQFKVALLDEIKMSSTRIPYRRKENGKYRKLSIFRVNVVKENF